MGDYLSADNIVALATALIGVGVSVAMVWYERLVRGKSIGYRVQMDIAVDSDNELFNSLQRTPDATLVLLRIENDGAVDIGPGDYTARDEQRALTVQFTGRYVQSAAVTQPDPGDLIEHFRLSPDTTGVRHEANKVFLPRVPLNPGEHYKLLIRLTGGPTRSGVEITGGIAGGKVKPNRSVPMDDKPPLFSRPARLITLMLTLCVSALAAIIVVGHGSPRPMNCATGHLEVTGSTAFEPVMRTMARTYTSACPDSSITVDAQGSEQGVRQLSEAGAAAPRGAAPAVVAMSDGPRPPGSYPGLKEHRAAVIAFALVVDDDVPVKNLTTGQIRGLYSGRITNWKQLPGGPDLPVLLVSRSADSGTRDIFRGRVLGGRGEPAFTSRDCRHKNAPSDRVVRCELDSTPDVLRTVSRLPGAIGYGEAFAAGSSAGLHTVAIDGRAPAPRAAAPAGYPFTDIEYAYTYGFPAPDSLAAGFLDFMLRGRGQDAMSAGGHLPCYTPEGLELCRP
ncbi:PstS family phosphate ABC transporter substrate-binding protein [Streptomyces fuscigenes]|uniref:PstS family phosphate ABC transporter substrate-binding protein n=1 Tax=Streptomyces fuscigenes TaxID=1528880 RepID=UPI001F2D7718|nr:substrate-binding domain-containing protein [Streptomyces fuscigenes]MCF3962404.1 substrate-binding domain-containing protein [Streptomyces fuscigenes]